jgi:hypothetical protein
VPFLIASTIKSVEIVGDGRVLLVPNHDGEKGFCDEGHFPTFLDILNEHAAKSAAKLKFASASR